MSEFREYILASNCITVELSNLQKQEFRVASSKVDGVILTGDYIHVIEYAALEQAEAKIKKLEAKLSIAVEALEFYGEFHNWYGEFKNRANNHFTDFSRTDLEQFEGHMVCGKQARQALKEFKERSE